MTSPKTGEPRKWIKVSSDQRLSIRGPYAQSDPWTSRHNVFMRGSPAQAGHPNFRDELVNVRWMQYCEHHGLNPETAEPPAMLFTDLRQNIPHQYRDGCAVLLTSSQIYHHLSDRTLTPLELFMNNGWPSSTILTGLNDLVPGWPSAAPKTHRAAAKPKAKASSSSTPLSRPRSRSHGPPPSTVELASKKRKAGAGRKKQCSSTALDLAANGMCLSDLFLIMYTSVLSTDGGMFENKPDFNATFQTTLDDQRAGPLVEVDASLDGPTIAEQVGIAAEDVGEVEGDEDEQHEDDDNED